MYKPFKWLLDHKRIASVILAVQIFFVSYQFAQACVIFFVPTFTIQKLGPATASPGDIITYQIPASFQFVQIHKDNVNQLTNREWGQIEDTIPAGLTFYPAGSSNHCSQVGNKVVCENELKRWCPDGSQDPNCAGIIRKYLPRQTNVIAFRIASDITCPSTITNTVRYWEKLNGGFITNQTKTATTQVINCPVPKADVTINKIGVSNASKGATIAYGLEAKNLGPDAAQNVVITDPIPNGLQFLDANSSNTCNKSGNNVVCSLGSIAANATKTITVRFKVLDTATCGNITNVARIATSTSETNTNNNSDSAVTTINCTCGDGNVDPGEQCDDGNTNNNDSCTNQCKNAVCGDGIKGPGEQCDDGNTNNNDSCTNSCTIPVTETDLTITKVKYAPTSVEKGGFVQYLVTAKNNGTVAANNVVIRDAIPAGLTFRADKTSTNVCAVVGNEVVCTKTTPLAPGAEWGVYIGFNVPDSYKTGTCPAPIANIARVTTSTTETNLNNNSATANVQAVCPARCGDGNVDPGEQCDDGNTNNNDSCTNQCKNAVCGDGIKGPGEQCDDGNTNNNDACSNQCKVATCGDGITQAGEQCDDGNTNNNDSCTNSCTIPIVETDLTITKVKYAPAPVQKGGFVQYLVKAKNNGTIAANNVVIRDTIPAGLTYRANKSSADVCAVTGNEVVCTKTTPLAAGAEWGVYIGFDVPSTYQNGTCPANITNVARVITSTTESNTNNNSATENVQAVCPARCGDGNVDSGEQCDDGNTNNNDSCTNQCKNAVCGDGIKGPGEQCDDGNTNNNDACSNSCNINNPSLTVQKTGPATIKSGNNLTYQFTVKNIGNTTATNVVTFDTFQTTNFNTVSNYVSATNATCSVNNNGILCNLGNLAVNATKTYSLTFKVPLATNLCDQTIINGVNVRETGKVIADTDSASTKITCDPNVDLKITKSGPSSVIKGNNVGFSLKVENLGLNNATNVVVEDTIPTGLQFESNGTDAICNQSGNKVVCAGFSLNAGASRTLNIAFKVPTTYQGTTCPATIHNIATVKANEAETNLANNSDTADVHVSCPGKPKLELTKDGPTTVVAGNTITYTFTTKNVGDAIAENVRVSDFYIENANPTQVIYPMPFTFVSASEPSCYLHEVNKRIYCRIGDLAPGQSKTHTLTFSTPANKFCDETIMNQGDAHIDGKETDASAWDKHQVKVVCPAPKTAILTVKKDGPATVKAGNNITYAFTVKNIGDAASIDTVLVDMFVDPVTGGTIKPAPFKLVNSTNNTNCTLTANQTISCQIVNLNPGQTFNFTATFSTPVQTYCGNTIMNQADVFDNANSATQIAWDKHSVKVSCDPVPECRDGIDNDNDGKIDFPADPGCTSPDDDDEYNPPAPQCSDGIDNDNDGKVDFPADPGCTSPDDDDETDNGAPNLTIAKTGPISIQAGADVTYQITVKNTGTAVANNVRVNDVFVGGTTTDQFVYKNATGADCTVNNQSKAVTCTLGSLQPNATANISIQFSSTANKLCSQTVQNKVDVYMNGANTSVQSDTHSLTVTCPNPGSAKLEIEKTGPASIKAGQNITYQFTVRNTGTADAVNVITRDAIQNNSFNTLAQYVSASGATCVPDAQNLAIQCNLNTIAAGSTKTFSLTFAVPSTNFCNTDLVNGVSILETGSSLADSDTATTFVQCDPKPQCSDGIDNDNDGKVDFPADPGCDSASDDNEVNGVCDDGIARVSVTIDDSKDPVDAGEQFDYLVRVTELDGCNGEKVDEVKLTLDNDALIVSADQNGSNNGTMVRWTNLTIPQSGLSLRATVRTNSSTANGEVLNSTVMAGTSTDTELTTVRNNDVGVCTCEPDLNVTVSDNADPVGLDDTITYSVRVRNRADCDGTVDVHGFFNNNDLDFVSASNGGTEDDDGEVVWNNLFIGGNDTNTLTVRLRTNSSLDDGDTVRLEVRVKEVNQCTQDTEDTERTSIETDNVTNGTAELRIDKSASLREARNGSIVFYTVNVRNIGNEDLEDIIVIDQPGSGIRIIDSENGRSVGGGVEWEIDLDAGETRVLRYRAEVRGYHGQALINTVEARADGNTVRDSAEIRIIDFLPVTGSLELRSGGNDTISRIVQSNNNAQPESLPFAMWSTIVTMGISIGSVFGKKILLI